ncbi:TetR family transcriptional regulator C-terminal domain-containing protein [Sungkyunkwania multivorans]|uniref:TetR family transcriptional regulator C-terminal domain-containing protein n=1 Tax=Sungkyunkwania multivorans TaxID=1173618 RepID=A0ABW3CW90_9FLAO
MAKANPISEKDIISRYMEYVLENEDVPKSIYKFCKTQKIKEEEFYKYFGSFESLRDGIWNRFHIETTDLIEKTKDYENYSNREKLLTYFFTFFELLTLNRSYVLYTLSAQKNMLRNAQQLKGLRKHMRDFAKGLIQEGNEQKQIKILKQPEGLFSEATWLQFLFLLKFWMEDNSAGFEKTDAAIEKSVNTAFDVFDNTPLDSIIDLGKFLWKEQMA